MTKLAVILFCLLLLQIDLSFGQSDAKYTYVGCFKDDWDRDLDPDTKLKTNDLTLEMCADRCQGRKYFSVQNGDNCFCGDDYNTDPDKYSKESDDDCDAVQCTGSTQKCGGPWRNRVFSLAAPETPEENPEEDSEEVDSEEEGSEEEGSEEEDSEEEASEEEDSEEEGSEEEASEEGGSEEEGSEESSEETKETETPEESGTSEESEVTSLEAVITTIRIPPLEPPVVTRPAFSRLMCYECHSTVSNAHCLATGNLTRCGYNQGSCQNTVRIQNGRLEIIKGCKQTQACENNARQNDAKPARGGFAMCSFSWHAAVCRCCCEISKCNLRPIYCRSDEQQNQFNVIERNRGRELGRTAIQPRVVMDRSRNWNQHPCEHNPCNNGGTCLVGSGQTYTCSCPTGFRDSHCNSRIRERRRFTFARRSWNKDPCRNNPCSNGGECRRGIGSRYTCICPSGFRDSHCNSRVPDMQSGVGGRINHPCEHNPCSNGGTCVRGAGLHYTCSCPSGWRDSHCNSRFRSWWRRG